MLWRDARRTDTRVRTQQLPLGLLNAAQGHPMLVELKNGETLNGHLVNCDTWMNLTLKEVVQTSPVRSGRARRMRGGIHYERRW